MQRTKNNYSEIILSTIQQQMELERKLEPKQFCKIIDGEHNISLEVWKADNLTHLQVLKYDLSKGCYGRLQYKNNPKTIQKDLENAIDLTCSLRNPEVVAPLASLFVEKLKQYEKAAFKQMKEQQMKNMMMKVKQ